MKGRQMRPPRLVFHTRSYGELAKRFVSTGNGDQFDLGKVEIEDTPDGEMIHKIKTEVTDERVILIGGTVNEKETLELCDIAFDLNRRGARSLRVLLPYFGYSTQEREEKGEIAKAKSRARILSYGIPQFRSGTQLLLLDPHQDETWAWFEGSVIARSTSAMGLYVERARNLPLENPVIVGADAGRLKQVDRFAAAMDTSVAYVSQTRVNSREKTPSDLHGDVEGRDVLMLEDMIRSGLTSIQAAQLCKERGARQVYLAVVHGVFTAHSIEKIRESGAIDKILVSDSHPNALKMAEEHGDLIEIVPIGALLREWVCTNAQAYD